MSLCTLPLVMVMLEQEVAITELLSKLGPWNRLKLLSFIWTKNCEIFICKEILWQDILHRWKPITVPRWNSLSSWERPILHKFVESMSRCLILTMKWLECLNLMIWMGEWINLAIYLAISCICVDSNLIWMGRLVWGVSTNEIKAVFMYRW